MATKQQVQVSVAENPFLPGEFEVRLSSLLPIRLEIDDDGSNADEIEWICNDGSLEIRFSTQVSSAAQGQSDPFGDLYGRYESAPALPTDSLQPILEAAGSSFTGWRHKYHLIVTTPEGNVASLDPAIIVRRRRA
jgi:hypothetical protein